MIGEASRSCFSTVGGSMPGGRRFRTLATASRTSGGGGAGVAGVDPHHREVDVGEAIDAELRIRGASGDDHSCDEHEGEDGAFNADFGEPLHGRLSAGG
jgi:hypothetical protein